MATKKLSDLPAATSVSGTDLLLISSGGTSYHATAQQVVGVSTSAALVGLGANTFSGSQTIVAPNARLLLESTAGSGGTASIYNDGNLSIVAAAGTPARWRADAHIFSDQSSAHNFLQMSVIGGIPTSVFSGAAVFPVLADASAPRGSIFWSANTANSLKACDPTGTIHTIF